MTELTPRQRQMRAQAAAYASWAKTTDRAARMAPAHKAAFSRFEQQVDPDGTLEPEERGLRAEAARKAFYRSMAYKSARARSQRSAQGGAR